MKLGFLRFAGKAESVQATGQKPHTVMFMDDTKNKLTFRVGDQEYDKWDFSMARTHRPNLGEERCELPFKSPDKKFSTPIIHNVIRSADQEIVHCTSWKDSLSDLC